MSVHRVRDFLGLFLVAWMSIEQLEFVARVLIAVAEVQRVSFNELARAMRPANMTDAAMLADVYRRIGGLPGGYSWSRALVDSMLSSTKTRLILATDWTTIGHLSVLVTAVVTRGRALPLLHSVADGFTDLVGMEAEHVACLAKLFPVSRSRITILADRGFGNARFLKSLMNHEFSFVIRSKIVGTISRSGLRPKRLRRDIEYVAGTLQDFGWVDFTVGCNMLHLRVVRSGDISHKEPWLLLTNLKARGSTIVRLYGCRFRIEGMFRDLKDCRYGMGLKGYSFRVIANFEGMFTVIATAYWAYYLAGLHAMERRWQNDYQSSSRRNELATWRLGLYVLRDEKRGPLVRADHLLRQSKNVTLKVGQWDWSDRPHEVTDPWHCDDSNEETKAPAPACKIPERSPSERECDFKLRAMIVSFMSENDLSQSQVALHAGLPRTNLNLILQGKRNASGSWITALAKLFDMPKDELMTATDWTPSKKGKQRMVRTEKYKRPPYKRVERECDVRARNRLRDLMSTRGVSPAAVAHHLNRSTSLIHAVLCGRKALPGGWLALLAELFNCTAEDFLAGCDWAPRTRRGPSNKVFSTPSSPKPAPGLRLAEARND